jgi:protein phosphatase
LLLEGFRAAHKRILEQASRHPELQGMGTTCTAIVLRGGSLYYAHVGDSRLYLVRDSKIDCLTRDQSYVGRLVEQGVISAEEALSHPHRNILIMALGVGPEILPESPEQPIALEKGDALLLCTDGLWSMVNQNEMQRALAGGTLEQACQDLVQMAKQRGAPDNITIQTVRTTV